MSTMTTIRVYEDEAYPDYILDVDHADVELDVPDDVAERWLAARKAWSEATDEIHAAYRAIKYADQPRYREAGDPPYPGREIR